ncbi:MAG TPA: hypothetical protein DD381_06200 [Lentisphaeria bacterium]|nr:MAG: hypothetical protein A2X47_05215 [Lentisphaerae bacterium GWF2_38_69]HBM15918.1 hypothetical protein [Lentisphaeria bacterium]
MFKLVKLFLFSSVIIIISSCGYHSGSIAHPQIRTIAFSPVINETYLPLGSAYMRQSLSEAFQRDGSWKVVSIEKADCIMYSRIVNVVIAAPDITIPQNSINYFTTQFGITVYFEFTIIIPGRPQPLVPTTQVSGQVQYQVPVDYYVSQEVAFQQACYEAALNAASTSTESW